jgi:hypothetical protein
VNNSDSEAWMNVESGGSASYVGLLSKRVLECSSGRLEISLPGGSGDIFVPETEEDRTGISITATVPAQKQGEKTVDQAGQTFAETMPKSSSKPLQTEGTSAGKASGPMAEEAPEAQTPPENIEIPDIPYDQMTVEQLQAVILSKMTKNGPVTDRMRRDVTDNIWHDSLVNWARSF